VFFLKPCQWKAALCGIPVKKGVAFRADSYRQDKLSSAGTLVKKVGGDPVQREVRMDVQGRLKVGLSSSFFIACLMAGLLAYPACASALEVGCFCTFVFVSTMFVIGVGVTVVTKYILSKKIWQLSMKRTALITFIEVILLIVILVLLQTKFYLRVLTYLPLAILLNYALTTAKGSVLQEQKTSTKRATMAVFSSLVLPVAVQLMAWVTTTLSELITFKEVRV